MVRRRRFLARLALGVAGTHLGLHLAARETARLGPARIRLAVRADRRGGTDVAIPPLGRAHLGTHRGPYALEATLTGLDEDGLGALAGTAPSELRAPLQADAIKAARRFATRAALAGIGGATALTAITLRKPGDVAAAGAVSALGLAALAAIGRATWDAQAWRDPELDGLLKRAPALIGDLRTAPERIETYQHQLAELVQTAAAVYRRVTDLPEPPPADAIRLLHVSDIHLNPIAFGLMAALIAQYDVSAVVDTGDLVDWGTAAETMFAGRIAGLGVPYVFVKGNHDSDQIAEAVARQPLAVVLDGAAVQEVAGLRFVGVADPRFTPDKRTGDDDTPSASLSKHGRRFAATAGSADIALAHDPAVARQLAGLAPLVLTGHTHRRAARRLGETLLLTQGSSGGSGLRGVQESPPTPFSLSVLHLDRATRRLHTVDDVTAEGIGRVDVHIVRTLARDLPDGRR